MVQPQAVILLKISQANSYKDIIFVGLLLLTSLGISTSASAQTCFNSFAPTDSVQYGANQTIENSGAINGTGPSKMFGVCDSETLTLNNLVSGTVAGDLAAIEASSANIINYGSIVGVLDGSFGIHTLHGATIANYGSISSETLGIVSDELLTFTNYGLVTAPAAIVAEEINLTNSGTIDATGGFGILAHERISLDNSGQIIGTYAGVLVDCSTTCEDPAHLPPPPITIPKYPGVDDDPIELHSTTITNSGFIAAGTFGIASYFGDATIINSGTVSGQYAVYIGMQGSILNSGNIAGSSINSVGIASGSSTEIINAGNISGSDYAINIGSSSSDTNRLVLLSGSRITGRIAMYGGFNSVEFLGGNQALTFEDSSDYGGGYAARVFTDSKIPYVVSSDSLKAASIDPTSFSTLGHRLMTFSDSVSFAVPDIVPHLKTGGTNSVMLYAETPLLNEQTPDPYRHMADIATPDGSASGTFANHTNTLSDESTVWARAFGGYAINGRDQEISRTTSQFFGGLIGQTWSSNAKIQVGAYVGAGASNYQIDRDIGEGGANLIFTGVFARNAFGAAFMNSDLQIGNSMNSDTRRINNNLVDNGIELATGHYNGVYVAPELASGINLPLQIPFFGRLTLTPSLHVKYLFVLLGGYTETGATDNLSVERRETQNFEGRAEIKLGDAVSIAATRVPTLIKYSLYGGISEFWKIGSEHIRGALLEEPFQFNTLTGHTSVSGYGGAKFELSQGQTSVFLGVEYSNSGEGSSAFEGKGGVNISF